MIRKLRIDELPQMWNVLKGEMNFVGPRPEREFFVQELEKKIPYYSERFTVKPGITGWAQVNGRNAITWEDKFKLDVWYVDNWSLWLDVKIIAMTVLKVLKREGISQAGHATAQEFLGSHAKTQRRKGKESI